jgi:hypothetical protein
MTAMMFGASRVGCGSCGCKYPIWLAVDIQYTERAKEDMVSSCMNRGLRHTNTSHF